MNEPRYFYLTIGAVNKRGNLGHFHLIAYGTNESIMAEYKKFLTECPPPPTVTPTLYIHEDIDVTSDVIPSGELGEMLRDGKWVPLDHEAADSEEFMQHLDHMHKSMQKADAIGTMQAAAAAPRPPQIAKGHLAN